MLTEQSEDQEMIIRRASESEMVTICTRVFARGSDFVCHDATTIEKDGVHVIMLFVPDCEAEFVQARGRIARQGNPGSYQEILLLPQLVEEFSLTPAEIENAVRDKRISTLLRTKRDAKHRERVIAQLEDATNAEKAHKATLQYQSILLASDREAAKDALLKLNRGGRRSKPLHNVLALDDSGSMSGQPWIDLIDAVRTFLTDRIAQCTAAGQTCADVVTIINHSHSCQVMCRAESIHNSPETKSRFRGGGNDFKAILDVCYKEFKEMDRETYTPVLIFMSDGGCGNGDTEMSRLVADMPEIIVKTIGFSPGCDKQKMERLANLGNGEYYFGENALSLKSEFENISAALSSNQPLYH